MRYFVITDKRTDEIVGAIEANQFSAIYDLEDYGYSVDTAQFHSYSEVMKMLSGDIRLHVNVDGMVVLLNERDCPFSPCLMHSEGFRSMNLRYMY